MNIIISLHSHPWHCGTGTILINWASQGLSNLSTGGRTAVELGSDPGGQAPERRLLPVMWPRFDTAQRSRQEDTCLIFSWGPDVILSRWPHLQSHAPIEEPRERQSWDLEQVSVHKALLVSSFCLEQGLLNGDNPFYTIAVLFSTLRRNGIRLWLHWPSLGKTWFHARFPDLQMGILNPHKVVVLTASWRWWFSW